MRTIRFCARWRPCWKASSRRRKWECGLRPVGAIGAYAPEGIRKEVGRRKQEFGSGNAECGKKWELGSGNAEVGKGNAEIYTPIGLKTNWELFVISYWLIVSEKYNPFLYCIYNRIIKWRDHHTLITNNH
jgi:hypothetical protein